jgi:type IV pilus assembly protein PilB
MAPTHRLKLGEILVQAGLVNESEVRSALSEQKWWGEHLGATLVRLQLISESDLTRALASQLDLPVVQLTGKQIHPDILELLPAEWAAKHHVVPLFQRDEAGAPTLFVGIGDPTDMSILEEVSAEVGMAAKAVVVAPSELEAAIEQFYAGKLGTTRAEELEETRTGGPTQPVNPAAGLGAGTETGSEGSLQPGRSVPSLAEREGAREPVGEMGPSSQLFVKALVQLLAEKGLIERSEFSERVQELYRQSTHE